MNRTDKTLIAVALVLLLISLLSLAGYDDYFRLHSRTNDERSAVAEIAEGHGDFRVKFHDEFFWARGRDRQKLVYDDAVFTGENSHASLRVGESQVDLGANTLVVIRKNKTASNLNISHGSLAAKVSKNDRLLIETGDGQRFEVTAVEKTSLAVISNARGTKVLVKSGNARIVKDGKVQSLKSRDNLAFQSLKPDPLQFISPLKTRLHSFNAVETVLFKWVYSSGRKIRETDDFTFEVGTDSRMTTILAKERLLGEHTWQMPVSNASSFYYRVKDGLGNFSEIRKISVESPVVPVIVKPENGQEISLPQGTAGFVDIEVAGVDTDVPVTLQVARDRDFNNRILDKKILNRTLQEPLMAGDYYLRAKATYDGVESLWSDVSLLRIVDAIDDRLLAQLGFPAKVLIPNKAYPKTLYIGPLASVQAYLQKTEPFASYFAKAGFAGHSLHLKKRSFQDEIVVTREFPANWIQPGLTEFSYVFRSGERVKTEPRSHRLYVEMESPRIRLFSPQGHARWTPILFAKSYELLLSEGSGSEKRVVSTQARYRFRLAPGRDYKLKARALNGQRVPISDWSEAATTAVPTPQNPVIRGLAEEKPVDPSPKVETRKDAVSDEKSTLHAGLDSVTEMAHRLGSWIWAGLGANFLSVKQAISDTADVQYRDLNGPSSYLEAGFLSNKHFGIVGSYKRTPGEIKIESQDVADPAFAWDIYSLEGLYALPLRSLILGTPVIWGVRAGFQYHEFPFLYVGTGRAVMTARNNMLMASLGAFADTQAKRWNYHWLMRYQHPMRSSSDDGNSFSVDPSLALDGALGASYRFGDRWRTGLFWYGQFHQYKFDFGSQNRSSQGEQSLFFSNLELRLGFDL
jgi:hypothetical protein